MAMVLRGVATSQLEESYKFFISRILKEDAEPAKPAVVTEAKSGESKTTVVTGEPAATIVESADAKPDHLANLKRLAGIK